MAKFYLKRGDCLKRLNRLRANCIYSLVTDPPAGISFMGKDWDHHKGGRDSWIAWMTEVMQECYRVMKPGAHGLVWAIPRTSHWTATALENAGFEIRDVITHLFGSGFPKSHNLGKSAGMEGWGTALKPASEHWVLIRKPISEKTVAANVLKWGTGGLNIDGARIPLIGNENMNAIQNGNIYGKNGIYGAAKQHEITSTYKQSGRFPANLVLDEQAAEMLDEQSGVLKTGGDPRKTKQASTGLFGMGKDIPEGPSFANSSGGASRFFYVAKASKKDRGEGNIHPTVKSTKLMEYLIKLITPPNGIILDPFMGSGSTGVAAKKLGFNFVGIEQSEEYFEIAVNRIKSFKKENTNGAKA